MSRRCDGGLQSQLNRRLGCFAGFVLIAVAAVDSFSPVGRVWAQEPPPEGGAAGVLTTGNNEPFSTLSLSLDIPGVGTGSHLEFTLGFGTMEAEASGTFFDSFSVTLQNEVAEHTALLVVADLFGPAWAPDNLGGLPLTPESISRAEIGFDSGHGVFGIAYAYAVSWLIPPEWLGVTGELFFDLFDNQNDLDSLAYFEGVKVVGQSLPAVYTVQSSASPHGPYADESELQLDETQQLVRLPHPASRRFYRLRANAETRLTGMSTEADRTVFHYDFVAPRVLLQTAASVTGPYATATDAVVDLDARTITLSLDEAPRFFRLEANVAVRITAADRSGDLFVVRFDFEPASVWLQSSAQPQGPYADEQLVEADRVNQTFAISRFGGARYFRFTPGDPRQFAGILVDGDQLVLDYRVVERTPGTASTVNSSTPP